MRLNVSFDELHAAVKQMGAPLVDFEVDMGMAPVDPIDLDLGRGIEISLIDVEHKNGLLSHKGRQVLLYIQDHGKGIRDVLEGRWLGKKYHVADCRTLKGMRDEGRFGRYVVTNDLTGNFYITGFDWNSGQKMEDHSRLKVCKNCLRTINYKGYELGGRQSSIFSEFSLEEFFSTHSSYFSHLPTQFAGPAAMDGYADDWTDISRACRASRHYVCEACGLDLSTDKHLLHTHHVDGVKMNNSPVNLRALCIVCHSRQACHGNMFVSREHRRRITFLRREQGKLAVRDWDDVITIADPGVEGLAIMCKCRKLPVPIVYYEVRDNGNNTVAELDLAWPNCRVGVAIDTVGGKEEKARGWKVWKVVNALGNIEAFASGLA